MDWLKREGEGGAFAGVVVLTKTYTYKHTSITYNIQHVHTIHTFQK